MKMRDKIKLWGGVVVGVAGLVTVFQFEEVVVGFTMALVGFGIAPIDRVLDMLMARITGKPE